METANLTGQDLAYWVARANARHSRHEAAVQRKHYGAGQPLHDPVLEPSMRKFVAETLGDTLPARSEWQ